MHCRSRKILDAAPGACGTPRQSVSKLALKSTPRGYATRQGGVRITNASMASAKTKSKITCICSVCDKQFNNITDHMLHYMKEHDEGYKEHEDRRQRGVTCAACLQEIKSADLVCACGYIHWSKTKTKERLIHGNGRIRQRADE